MNHIVRMICFFMVFALYATPTYALQSTIMMAEGYACMGDDKSRKQTEQAALVDAKRKAVEDTVTYVKSVTKLENYEVVKDIVDAYANAQIRILERKGSWYRDEHTGECYKITIKAEIIPDERVLQDIANRAQTIDNPVMPLQVSLWTDKKEYKSGDKIKIYLRGNKPFYARVVYRDMRGESLQLLPNPYRKENYFNGGVIYEIPAGDDRFELVVSPPYGEEQIILYASTSPLGDLSLKEEGAVYQIKTREKDIGIRTRGVKIVGSGIVSPGAGEKGILPASEFFEGTLKVKTGP